jgi:putative peptidoglycan lipid II flippase
MMLPRTMSLAVTQVNLLVITSFASVLNSGSLAVFNFANNLQSFPVGLFGISYAVAAFPAFSAAAFDREKLVARLSSAVRQVLFFIVPATVLLLTLRAQVVRLILGSGSFDWQDTIMTLDTLGFFALSLFAQALVPTLVRVYYARHDSRTPFLIGLASEVTNFALAWFLMRRMGVAGLALAFSIASIINFVLLWVFLHGELEVLDEKRIFRSALKFSVAAIACGLAVQGMKFFLEPYLEMDKVWGVAVQGLFSASFGLFVYFAACSLLKSEEAAHYWRTVTRRLPWTKIETDDRSEARGI